MTILGLKLCNIAILYALLNKNVDDSGLLIITCQDNLDVTSC